MNKKQLEHVLRALSEMLRDSNQFQGNFVLFGSQAILAHMDPDFFPEAQRAFLSAEIDIAADTPDPHEQAKMAEFIWKNIGEGSRFDQAHGAYADGVALETPTFPAGWRERLVEVRVPGQTESIIYMALSVQDIVASKLYAGRQKDLDYIEALFVTQHPDLVKVSDTLENLPDDPKSEKSRVKWAAHFAPKLPRKAPAGPK